MNRRSFIARLAAILPLPFVARAAAAAPEPAPKYKNGFSPDWPFDVVATAPSGEPITGFSFHWRKNRHFVFCLNSKPVYSLHCSVELDRRRMREAEAYVKRLYEDQIGECQTGARTGARL